MRALPTLLTAAAALAMIAGPVAAAHDPKLCAGDIAAAFLADPTKQPDVACAQVGRVQAQVRAEVALPTTRSIIQR